MGIVQATGHEQRENSNFLLERDLEAGEEDYWGAENKDVCGYVDVSHYAVDPWTIDTLRRLHRLEVPERCDWVAAKEDQEYS